ncbi:MAG: HpcH/HpaI aldolase/citrate lyase family protein, partial [Propylenella sp.]
IAKARTLAADAVIFDLEDSVAPEAKSAAREALRQALGEPLSAEVAVRINGLDTAWATEDILAAIAVRADAVLVPKVEGPGAILTVADALTQADALDATEIWAMVETPKALLHLPAIAALADDPAVPLAAFVIGTNDLSLATRVPLTEDRAAFVPWFMQIVAAARAHGIDVIDGPLNAFRDIARLEAECRQARALGMDGKSLIHPGQIEAANRIFAPTAAEREAAEAVVAAFALPENIEKAVIALEGRMIERLHLTEAERVLTLALAIKERERR